MQGPRTAAKRAEVMLWGLVLLLVGLPALIHDITRFLYP